ncbi:MAG: hypothetical protein AAF939_12515 [Planctomycetota bacterium]
MIVFLTTDLMMASNARSHARQHSVTVKTAESESNTVEVIQADRPHLLLVDLQTPGLNIESLGEQIRKMSDSMTPLTVAFAQHVNVDLLEKAKTAGFDQVLTRGQFNNQIGRIISDTAL